MNEPQFSEKLTFKYEILNKIGEGNYGETWLARDRMTHLKVAIKCLKSGAIEDIKAIELFEREAELLKSTQVHGVPKFYQYDAPSKTTPGILVQEYVDAPSLQNLLDAGERFDEMEALNVGEKVSVILNSLQTLYSPPIIHRDIKPSNVLYHRGSGEVYLIDFGSVANPQKRDGGSTIAGTFGYMPPEQIMGEAVIQSDYYALGATLLHMLTGVQPCEMPAEMYKLDFVKILKEKVPKIHSNTVELLQTLLDPDPSKRPPSAYELSILFRQTKLGRSLRPKKVKSLGEFLLSKLRFFAPRHDNETALQNVNSSSTQNIITIKRIRELVKNNEECENCLTITQNWIRCDGMIQGDRLLLKEFGEKTFTYHVLEYTFFVNDLSWCGICVIGTEPQKTNMTYPVQCQVIYDPLNPRKNALYSYEASPASPEEQGVSD